MSETAQLLLIDDERDILSGLSVRLGAQGFGVHRASDASKGLKIAAEKRPDLILMDITMPGMDGLELLAQLKKDPSTRDIPVVVLSANVIEKTRAEALHLGARRFLEKPFQPDKLLAAIRGELTARQNLKKPAAN